MEKTKFRTVATAKSLNRSLSKLASMIRPWSAPDTQNFVAIGLRVSAPQIRDFDMLQGVTSFNAFCVFATDYLILPCLWDDLFLLFVFGASMRLQSELVPGKEVLFGRPDD